MYLHFTKRNNRVNWYNHR